VKYHHDEVSKEEALTTLRNANKMPMEPIAYVPWDDANEPLCISGNDVLFRFLQAGPLVAGPSGVRAA
jgi:hypothetical protein